MITDNDMPKVTGVELMQKMQAARLALPVIMATGAVPDEQFTRYSLLQPAMTLIKPYTFDELLDAVTEVLRTASGTLGEMLPPPDRQIQPPIDRVRL